MSKRRIVCDGETCRIIDDGDDNSGKTKVKPLPLPSLDEKHYTLYGASYCGYCESAKSLLEDKKCDYNYVEINTAHRDKLRQMTNGYQTIPVIFKGDRFIGGYSELKELLG